MAIVSFALSLIGVEFVLRAQTKIISNLPKAINLDGNTIFQCYQIDPTYIYRTVPGSKDCEPIDSEGFRSDPTGSLRADKTIVVIGDSYVYGTYAADDETFPYQLERILRSRGNNANVVNAGIPGYGTDQEYLYLTQYVLGRVHPDLVIWTIHENDWFDNDKACLIHVDDDALRVISARRNTMYITVRMNMLMPQFIKNLALYKLILSVIPESKTIGCSSNGNSSVGEISLKMARLFHSAEKIAEKEGLTIVYVFVEGQRAFIDNRDTSSDYVRTITEKIATLLEYKILPFIASPEIFAKAQSVDTSNSPQMLSLDSYLFSSRDPAVFGAKHFNDIGNTLFAESVADYLQIRGLSQ